MTLLDVIVKFPTDDACRKFLEEKRWPSGITCPKCGHDKITRLTTRKQFTCARKSCRYRFSVTSGTIFHASHIRLQKWFLAIYLLSDAKKSASSLQLNRELDISQECCWHMCHRIRAAMSEDASQAELFKGIVAADEYWHGGAPRPENRGKGKRGKGTDKQPILGVYEMTSGRIKTTMIPDTKGSTFTHFLRKMVDMPKAELHTDEATGYNLPGTMFAKHKTCNHQEWYVSKEGVHTNHVENAWSLFARAVMGSFHSISVKHLPLYLQEFYARFNARNTTGFFDKIIAQTNGRRLPMKELVNQS